MAIPTWSTLKWKQDMHRLRLEFPAAVAGLAKLYSRRLYLDPLKGRAAGMNKRTRGYALSWYSFIGIVTLQSAYCASAQSDLA